MSDRNDRINVQLQPKQMEYLKVQSQFVGAGKASIIVRAALDLMIDSGIDFSGYDPLTGQVGLKDYMRRQIRK